MASLGSEPAIEFTPKWFDATSRCWRRNKVYSRCKQRFFYKDTSDNQYSPKEMRGRVKDPNAKKWLECCYIDSSGVKCSEMGNLYEDDIAENPYYDVETFTKPHFCDEHEQYEIKEIWNDIEYDDYYKAEEKAIEIASIKKFLKTEKQFFLKLFFHPFNKPGQLIYFNAKIIHFRCTEPFVKSADGRNISPLEIENFSALFIFFQHEINQQSHCAVLLSLIG